MERKQVGANRVALASGDTMPFVGKGKGENGKKA